MARLILFKISQIITVAGLGLHIVHNEYEDNYMRNTVYIMAFAGFSVILLGKLVGIATGERLSPLPDTLLSAVGAVCNIAAGCTLLEHYADTWHTAHIREKGLHKGALCVINTAFICIDMGFVNFT